MEQSLTVYTTRIGDRATHKQAIAYGSHYAKDSPSNKELGLRPQSNPGSLVSDLE